MPPSLRRNPGTERATRPADTTARTTDAIARTTDTTARPTCVIAADGNLRRPPRPRRRVLVPGALDAGRPRALRRTAAVPPAGGARHRGAADVRRAGADPPRRGRAAHVLAAVPDRARHRELLLARWSATTRTPWLLLLLAPDGEHAYALAAGRDSTAVWLVAGGAFGPEHLAEVPGPCSGGVWLDDTGRLLALDRHQDGRTKTVVVDLGRGGEVTPLLQIAEDSDDRLLLADADSGLLLVVSTRRPRADHRSGLGSAAPCRSASPCSARPTAR